MIFLGVDGGGSKTALVLLASDGTILAAEQTGASYLAGPPGVGPRHVAEVLGTAVTAVCDKAGIGVDKIDYAFFGLPAYGELSADDPLLDAVPAPILGHDRYQCDNDMVCGWAGSLALADGINVVAGTGSIAYGRKRDLSARCGGWGELFGDEGSGYWIGLRALQTFSQMSDGRLPAGPLYEQIRNQFGLDHDLDLLDVVMHEWSADRSRIAALTPIVGQAAEDGDGAAQLIVSAAADELLRLVDAVRSRVDFGDQTVTVSYSGGVFGVPGLLERFRVALADRPYRLQQPTYPPVIGAALYAAQLAGEPLDDNALARIPGSP